MAALESIPLCWAVLAASVGGVPLAVLLDGREHDLAVVLQLLGCKLQRVAVLLDGREHDLAVASQLLRGVPQRPAVLSRRRTAARGRSAAARR